jgi:hypothetical protein
MPAYTYFCHTCDEYFEVTNLICDYKEQETCPTCETFKNVTRELGYDISTIHRNVRAGDDDITLGQLADRNTKRLSRDEKISKYYDQNKYRWEGEDKSLPDGMTRVNKTDKDSVMSKIEKKIKH